MDLNWHYIIPYSFPYTYKTILITLGLLIGFSAACYFSMKKEIWRVAVGSLCICYWIFLVVAFTMLGRERTAEPQIELHLFWCIKEAWQYKDMEDWYLIIGNILLFIPLGIIVTIFFEKMRSCWKVILAGFGDSLCIEVAQLASHRGLFELDDLFHNTLGCYLGYALVTIVLFIMGRNQKQKVKCIVAVSVWTVVIGFFAYAVFMGQPVFGYFVS